MVAGIILAGGKGTRLKSESVNKVTLPFAGKPMIQYGVEVLHPFVSQLIVVVGAYADSVKSTLASFDVEYATQEEQLGTGHAVKIALPYLRADTDHIIVGYGDHMMFYQHKTVERMIKRHSDEQAAVTCITTSLEDPAAYGRILRDEDGYMYGIVEKKDATPGQLKIKEINAGFYIFNAFFLQNSISLIKPSPVSKEYYLTDLVDIAVKSHQPVIGMEVPYQEVGIGINTQDELTESLQLYQARAK